MNLEQAKVWQSILRRHARTRLECPDAACHAQGGRLILKLGRGRFFYGCTRYGEGCRQSCNADQRTGDPNSASWTRAKAKCLRDRGANFVNLHPIVDSPRTSTSFKPSWSADVLAKKRRIILEEE
jgi:hypothetical protein